MGMVLEGERLEAKRAGHARHVEYVRRRLARMPSNELPRALLEAEQQRRLVDARLIRNEIVHRQPGLYEHMALEAAAYHRRYEIDQQDGRDPMCFHLALAADLRGRDVAGVEHELEMYRRLGWQHEVIGCQEELRRRQRVENGPEYRLV